MATVKDILHFLETIAPEYMKEQWDKVGLNCGHPDAPVQKILLALDPFDQVCKEAKDFGADLLITHHALIWEPGFVTDETATGRRTLFLIENGIAHCNAHTNLDCAPGGVNDVLANTLGLSQIEVMDPKDTDHQGRPYGLLRCGYVEETALADFLSHVKDQLGTPTLRFVNGGKPVRKVAVGGGACADFLYGAAAAGCDTFVTSDVKYNQFWDAKELGLNLIDAGHFYTENPVISHLHAAISLAFPEIEVKVSQTHQDCMDFA